MKTDSKNGREHIMQQGNDSGVADFSGMLNEMTLKFMSEGVLGFNPEGIIVYANPAAVFITGISEEELPGSNLLMLFPEADRREMQGVLGKMDDACGPFPRIFRTRRNGKQISIKILPVEKEGCRFAIAILNDVSHHLRMEAQIQRAEKMEAIGTLAGVVAHDLNNILSGLVSYPELLLLQLPQGNPLRKPIHTIQKAGEKAAAVVQDLLTLARRGIVVSDVVNFNDVLIEHLKSPEYEKLLQDHPKVHLQTRLAKNLTHISGSPAHLSKTIVSLISNAVVAMPDGGDILVSTENRYLDKPIRGYSHVVPGDYVVLNVSDTGTGLSTEDVERIFEPFYTKKKMGRSGTGLGMAVVWGVVEDHKGYIDVQNRQGRGTVFTLYFPAIPRELPEDKTGLSISSIMGNGESILIVDDVRELPKNNLRILFALLPVFYVVKTGT